MEDSSVSEDKINKKLNNGISLIVKINTLMHKRPVLFVVLTIAFCLLMAFIIGVVILFIFG